MNNKTFFKEEEDGFVNVIEKCDKSTQTNFNIENLLNDINRLDLENNQLTNDYKELIDILSLALKLENNKDIDIHKIKTHLQIIINREIRRKFAIPFVKFINK